MLLSAMLLTSVPCYAAVSQEEPDGTRETGNAVISAEDVSKRGAFEKHYLLSDGSFIAVAYPEEIHCLGEDGTWQEIDNRLYHDASSRIVNGQGDFAVSFADRPAENAMASLSQGGRTFSWGLSAGKRENGEPSAVIAFADEAAVIRGGSISAVSDRADAASGMISASAGAASAAMPSAVGKKIKDADAFANEKAAGKVCYGTLFQNAPELSVEYSVYHNKIEEDIYINAPTELRSFLMNIRTEGLAAHLNDDGSVDFTDENGDMQYRIGIPYMSDAADEVLHDIQVTVSRTETGWCVTYTPDEAWLTSAERAYPILLDPSVTTKEYRSNISDTYVYEGNTEDHSAEQRMTYGVKSGKIHRAYIKVNNLPKIDAGMPVLGATMQLTFLSGTTTGKTAQVYKASGAWSAGSLNYANQPAIYASNRLSTCSYVSGMSYLTFDLTKDVTALYDEFAAGVNYGYVIKYEDESTTNPDYNVLHAAESTATAKNPLITVTYGYALPSSLQNGSVYSFRNCGSQTYMTVHDGVDANTTNVYLRDVASVSGLAARHKFKLEYVESTGGYYLRAMCSSGGTNRVLDIVKINGYVTSGGNVQIYAANDPLAQHWFIIGTGTYSFKIVPRTDMSLALTARDGEGSASGTGSSSAGNVYVSSYSSTNTYQQWEILDSTGNLMSGSTQLVENATYYLNNRYYGKYLYRTSNLVDAESGLISSLGNKIRWKITHVGDNRYTIQSASDLKYLYASNSAAMLSAPSEITDRYLWTLSTASGGGMLIRNVGTKAYLKQESSYTISLESSLGTVGTMGYDRGVWRTASTSYYGNSSTTTKREFSANSKFYDCTVLVSRTAEFRVNKYWNNEMWCNATTDFTYSVSPYGKISIDSGIAKANATGLVTVTATHKVTGRVVSFKVTASGLAIYQTRNRERLGFATDKDDDVTPITPEDLLYGQKSTNTLLYNGTLISTEDLYEQGVIIPKSKRVTTIKNYFHSQISNDPTFTVILDEMIDHFLDGSGTDYSDADLTEAVKTHNHTTAHVNSVIRLVKQYLVAHDGEISGLYYDEGLWVQPAQRALHPLVAAMNYEIDKKKDLTLYLPSYGYNNGVPGLSLAINGWYGSKIEIESYAVSGSSYSGTLRFTFYDHFGLDTNDLKESKEILNIEIQLGIVPAFRQWYILQHWDSLGESPQPKPFVTRVSYTVSFSGSF